MSSRMCANKDAEVIPETSCFMFLYGTLIGMLKILLDVFDFNKCVGDLSKRIKSWINGS